MPRLSQNQPPASNGSCHTPCDGPPHQQRSPVADRSQKPLSDVPLDRWDPHTATRHRRQKRATGLFPCPRWLWTRWPHIWRSSLRALTMPVSTLSGKPITRSMFGHEWRAAAQTAGPPAGTGFHALRHYYASLLIRHGESVKTVQARVGHASAVETLDTYSHLWPDSDDRTRDAIDSVLGSSADPLRTEAMPNR
jgi:integrase